MLKHYVLVDLIDGIPKSVEISESVFWNLQKFVVEILGGYSWHEIENGVPVYDIRKGDGTLIAYEAIVDE